MAQIDYDALAKQAGAIESSAPVSSNAPTQPTTAAPATSPGTSIDYDALAKQAGSIESQTSAAPKEDTGVLAGIKRNTVGAVTGIYHALTDPATEDEKAALLQKVKEANARGNKIPEDFATNPSRATLAYHRIVDAPAEALVEKGHNETEAAKDLLEHHEYWKGGNMYLSGLTDKLLSAVPLAGPQINSIAERGEKGDFPGAATDVAALMVPENAKEIAGAVGDMRAARVAQTASRVAGEDFLGGLSDEKKAIPSTRTAPVEDVDRMRSRIYLEKHHEEVQPIRTVTDYRDAADHEIKKMDGQVKDLVGIIPNEKIATNVLDDVRAGLEQISPKKDFVENGMKELIQSYDLNNPTMSEADRIREDLNAENQSAMSKNKYRRSVARKTDPGFAARELAANSIREGVYNQLENHGIEGARELRQDQGSLIKMRNAAEAQILNGDKVIKGTGGASLGKNLAKTAIQGTGATAGAALGGSIGGAMGGPLGGSTGAGVGALTGTQLATQLADKVLNMPSDLTRDALIERSFGKKIAAGQPVEPTVNLRAPTPAAPTGQQPLLTNPSTLFDLNQTGTDAFASPADIIRAQTLREEPFQAVLDDPAATAGAKERAQAEIQKLQNTPVPREMIRPGTPTGPVAPPLEKLAENSKAYKADQLARREEPWRAILNDPLSNHSQRGTAYNELAKISKEFDKDQKEAEKAAANPKETPSEAPKAASEKPKEEPKAQSRTPRPGQISGSDPNRKPIIIKLNPINKADQRAVAAGGEALAGPTPVHPLQADIDALADKIRQSGADPNFAQTRARQIVEATSGEGNYTGMERRNMAAIKQAYEGAERRNPGANVLAGHNMPPAAGRY